MRVTPPSEPEPWPIDGLLPWAESAHRQATGLGLGAHEVVRATPWSTVVRWSVGGALVWGKAACPGFAAECSLLPLLADAAPGLVLAPLAVEAEYGWMLLPDGGPTLKGSATVPNWTRMLLAYAELQRVMVGREAELIELGCPDLRPNAAVDRFEQMMEHGHVAEHRWLIDAARSVATRIDLDLVPATIQHDDLRPGNVFADGRVFDWGDSSVAHPFATLLTALMPDRDRPGTDDEKADMRDAYLRSWQRVVGIGAPAPTLEVLRNQADLAIMLAPIGRIDTWLRAPAAALDLYPDAVARWVNHMLATDWP